MMNICKYFEIWTHGSEGNAIKRYFLSTSLVPSCSAERIHLGNFGRLHYEEHFCQIILNLDQVVRKEILFKDISYLELL